MASFPLDSDGVDEAKEYLQMFNRHFQDNIISIANSYTESVANYFHSCSNNNSSHENESGTVKDEIGDGLDQLLLGALKLSQTLLEKCIQHRQQ